MSRPLRTETTSKPAAWNISRAATQLGVTLSSLGLGWAAESVLAHAVNDVFAGMPNPSMFNEPDADQKAILDQSVFSDWYRTQKAKYSITRDQSDSQG